MAGDQVLARVELTFRTDEDPQALADRVQEAVALIVGREALEEFRLRVLPLSERPKGSRD
jgi:predicted component of type VI protein secretion system